MESTDGHIRINRGDWKKAIKCLGSCRNLFSDMIKEKDYWKFKDRLNVHLIELNNLDDRLSTDYEILIKEK